MKKLMLMSSIALIVSLAASASLVGNARTNPPMLKSYVIFSEMISEAPFLIAFPDGGRIATSYDLHIPLGVESSLLEV